MRKTAWVDCETTGLDIDLHEVWEVGVIVHEFEKEEVEKSWLLPVGQLAFADRSALEIGRFHDRHPQGIASIDPKDGRWSKISEEKVTDLETFARQFVSLTRGAQLAGSVVSFDEERLRKIVRSVGLVPAWSHRLLDVGSFTAGVLGYEDPVGLDTAAKKLSVDASDLERHTALGDARLAHRIYQAGLRYIEAH